MSLERPIGDPQSLRIYRKYGAWKFFCCLFIFTTLAFSITTLDLVDGKLRLSTSLDLPVNYYRSFSVWDGSEEKDLELIAIDSNTYEKYRRDIITRARIAIGGDDYYSKLENSDESCFTELAAGIREYAGNDDELFVNMVLQVTHQFKYDRTLQAKYAVETFVEGSGDCDCLSVFAASLLKADGRIAVILLLYKPEYSVGIGNFFGPRGHISESEGHMQIGVALKSPPSDSRQPPSGVTYYNLTSPVEKV